MVAKHGNIDKIRSPVDKIMTVVLKGWLVPKLFPGAASGKNTTTTTTHVDQATPQIPGLIWLANS